MSALPDLRVQDAAARSRAQREFHRPLVLEAGAGTGKTATLVARVVAWCLGPGWERAAADPGRAGESPERIAARVLSRVVAITFTEAAAAEMAARVEQALVAVEHGEAVRGLERDALPEPALCRARAAALRDGLEQLVVQTLHAYARRLLAAHPFEAGLHPQLAVDADGSVRRVVVRTVLDRALRTLYAHDGDALALAAAGRGPRELERELMALLEAGVAARDLAGDPLAPERIAACCERLRQRLVAFDRAEGGRLASATRSPVAVEAGDLVHRLLARLSSGEPGEELLAELAGLVRDQPRSLERIRRWAKGQFGADERRALAAHRDAVAAAAAPLASLLAHVAALELETLPRAQRLMAALLAEVERALDRRGVASFGSLLARAAWLLESRPDVARAVRRDLDQLLVDEFQDTDPLQCAIVGALALAGDPAERPGLFLVGDPKQSIYGWRDADLAAYEEFVARALAEGGERHRLSVNHRSLPAVLDEVERVIAPVMRREPGVQPDFEPLVASEANAGRAFEASERFAGVEHWIAAPWNAEAQAIEETSASQATRIEARALAADLLALHHDRGVAWRSVGVLFRSRGDWDVYLSALREAGVPFAVEGDRSYFRRREIIDAAAWVRCVLDPDDVLALVAALRSSAVGVPDAAWVPLFARGLPERVAGLARPDPEALAALRDDVAEAAASLGGDVPGLSRVDGWPHNAALALAAIASLRASFESEPADLFVEKLRESLLLEASEAARFLGPWRVANLERFFRELTEELSAGADTQEVLRRLRHAVSEEEEMEEEPPHDTAADAVQVLTLHGAKGLDFGHVYLMQLHKGTGRPQGRPQLDAARVDGRLELRLLGYATLGFDRVAERRRQVADAELVRLLYVGMTRARERLVLSGAWPRFLQQRRAGLAVELLEQRRELPDLAALLTGACREGRCAVDAGGARFVLPAQRAPVPAPGGEARDASAPGASEAAPRPVRPWAGLQREAELRMARPLGGRASDEPLRDDASAGEPGPVGPRGTPRAAAGEAARLAGSAVHRVLETLDLSLPVAQALPLAAAGLPSTLAGLGAGDGAGPALAAAGRVLERLAGGALGRRLERIRSHVVARELPVLLPPGPEDDALAFVSGAVDLVYHDPASGDWVVVDFKTDDVEGRELDARAARYARQGGVYQRALREALSLSSEPRLELWFLAADRCIEWSAPPTPEPEPGPGPEPSPEQLRLTLS